MGFGASAFGVADLSPSVDLPIFPNNSPMLLRLKVPCVPNRDFTRVAPAVANPQVADCKLMLVSVNGESIRCNGKLPTLGTAWPLQRAARFSSN